MINFHESMGLGQDRTQDPWICSQTRICCQTSYRLCCVVRSFLTGHKCLNFRTSTIIWIYPFKTNGIFYKGENGSLYKLSEVIIFKQYCNSFSEDHFCLSKQCILGLHGMQKYLFNLFIEIMSTWKAINNKSNLNDV